MNCSRCGSSLPTRSILCASCGQVGSRAVPKDSAPSPNACPAPMDERLAGGAGRSNTPASVGALGDHSAGEAARRADFGSYWSELNNVAFVQHGWEDVKGCEFVRGNKIYGDLADRITLEIPLRHPHGPHATEEEEVGSAPTPLIVYPLEDVLRQALMACCFSLLCSKEVPVRVDIKRRLRELPREPAVLLRRQVHWLQRQHHEVGGLSIMREVCLATVRVVLAHELGHHALGHLSTKQRRREYSLNQEREADSFSSSVLHCLPLRHACIVGVCLFHASLAIPKTPTHPSSRERVRNYIEANPRAVDEACERYRISLDELQSLFFDM